MCASWALCHSRILPCCSPHLLLPFQTPPTRLQPLSKESLNTGQQRSEFSWLEISPSDVMNKLDSLQSQLPNSQSTSSCLLSGSHDPFFRCPGTASILHPYILDHLHQWFSTLAAVGIITNFYKSQVSVWVLWHCDMGERGKPHLECPYCST